MSTVRFVTKTYLKTNETQYSMRVEAAHIAPLSTEFRELANSVSSGRNWSLPTRVKLAFNGTPMGGRSETTLSYYPKAGGYVEFNVNKGTALYNFVEQKHPDNSHPGIEFDAELGDDSGSWVVNVVARKV